MYEVTENGDGTKTYTRARTKATAYYRWDQGAIPAAEAFPPGFRMIAHSNDFGADVGEIGERAVDGLERKTKERSDSVVKSSSPHPVLKLVVSAQYNDKA